MYIANVVVIFNIRLTYWHKEKIKDIAYHFHENCWGLEQATSICTTMLYSSFWIKGIWETAGEKTWKEPLWVSSLC